MKKIALIISGMILFLILTYIISGLFLSYRKPVKSSYVLLEEWIFGTTIEDAIKYIVDNEIDSVFIVGMKDPAKLFNIEEIDKTKKLPKKNNTYGICWNSLIGFEIPSEKLNDTFLLSMNMYGTLDDGYFPHYNIYLNEQVIGSGYVNENNSVYQFTVSKPTPDSVLYISINYDNDFAIPPGDRNLFVSDISIDSKEIDTISSNNFFSYTNIGQKINFRSRVENLKYLLGDRGYDTSRVKPVVVKYDTFNKTLAFAKGAKKYFSNSTIENINFITIEKHSRRSYLNFKNCLDDIDVGSITFKNEHRERFSLYISIDERISLILTWVYWWFH